jgi:hypothetical protein
MFQKRDLSNCIYALIVFIGDGMGKCEFRNRCAAYRVSSVTCNTDHDKSYCGIYKQFFTRKIKIYKLKVVTNATA